MSNPFHKLEHNESEFPHIGNVDVFKFDNEFDYARYDYTQMELQLCTVPWDVGEAHVGQRTISGIGNVVYFGSKEKRNAWFDAIPDTECYRFETKFKELHREQVIDVPIPYDVAARFNYLRVKYHLFANDDSPVQYETNDGLKEWFWFVREVEFVAPNTTRLHLLDDAFQTWIYDVTVSGMILERGHAPMFSTRAGKFLENPISNNTYLLTEDVNFGDATQVSYTDAVSLNANNVYACVATSALPTADWGTKSSETWRTPAAAAYTNNGAPSVFVFAIAPGSLNTFLSNISSSVPQFKQTVQGVFFASTDLLTLGNSFTFGGTTCYMVSSSRNTINLAELTKGRFGYDSKYADIAKLYTYPYAHIEVVDENGNTDVIKIEDTTGTIDISVSLSLAYPFVNIDAHLLGVGSPTRRNITFRNVDSHTFAFGGTWYETLHSWKVPTFAVVLDAATEYDYATHFDRKQARIAYENVYSSALDSANVAKVNAENSANVNQTNAVNAANIGQTNAGNAADAAKNNADASADTAKANIDASADVSKTNSDADADTYVRNTSIQVAANSSITAESNARALTDANYANGLQQALQAWEAGYARSTANNQVDAAYASAAIGAAGGAASSAISGASSGAALGPAGAIAGAVGGLVSGAISGAVSMAQTAVAANLTYTQAENTVTLSQNKVNETSRNNTDRTYNQNAANTNNVNASNTASTGVAANSAATTKANATRARDVMKANATREQTTAKANAARTYNAAVTNAENTRNMQVDNAGNTRNMQVDNAANSYNVAVANAGRARNTAQNAIVNAIDQAALRQPFIYGNFADGDSATTKPIALFSNIVTQSKSAIASAGDEFLRYGYMLNRQWDFDGDWNVGKYFTYWKLKDFWVKNLNVPDLYMDKLRFFLFGGVTVWRAPEYIGNIDVYENFND